MVIVVASARSGSRRVRMPVSLEKEQRELSLVGWYEVLRYVVLGAAGWLALVAAGSALVRARRIPPFSPLARTIRRLSDPWIVPVEQRLVRSGRNPQQAPWWLAGAGVVGGLLVLFVSQWLYGFYYTMVTATRGGPGAIARLIVDLTYNILFIALAVRVIGSWFGVGRYRRWMRPAYALTDWMIDPLRRFVPPIAGLDFTPFIAIILLSLARRIIFGIL